MTNAQFRKTVELALLVLSIVAVFGVAVGRAEDSATHGIGSLTSFEEAKPGPFDLLKTPIGTWTPVAGKSIVDDKHASTGNQCLQLTGGEGASVTLNLAQEVDATRVLTFLAERWTQRNPFSFRIDKQTDDGWQEIYNGDEKVRVGRGFLSRVVVPLGDDMRQLRFSVTSPLNTGVLIDEVRIALASEIELPLDGRIVFRQRDIPEGVPREGHAKDVTKFGYRIPSLLVTKEGSILAFSERRLGLHDHAQNDIVLKRSTDDGKTWSEEIVAHEDGMNSINDPLTVQLENGRILLMFARFPYGRHSRAVSYTHLTLPTIYSV